MKYLFEQIAIHSVTVAKALLNLAVHAFAFVADFIMRPWILFFAVYTILGCLILFL